MYILGFLIFNNINFGVIDFNVKIDLKGNI